MVDSDPIVVLALYLEMLVMVYALKYFLNKTNNDKKRQL